MGHTIQCSPVEVDQPYFFLHTVFESKLHPRWWSPDFWTINSRTWTSGLWFWFVSLTFFETTQYKNQWFVTRHWSLMDDWSNWFDPIPWEETSSELATNLTSEFFGFGLKRGEVDTNHDGSSKYSKWYWNAELDHAFNMFKGLTVRGVRVFQAWVLI